MKIKEGKFYYTKTVTEDGVFEAIVECLDTSLKYDAVHIIRNEIKWRSDFLTIPNGKIEYEVTKETHPEYFL